MGTCSNGRAPFAAQDAAAITDIFLSETPRSTVFVVEGQPLAPDDKRVETPIDAVTPNYFHVMGIPLLRGRAFTDQDRSGSPDVAIINEEMASSYWPEEDAVGKRFKFGDDADSQAPWMTVVGVVGDAAAMAGPVRQAVRTIDPNQPVFEVRTMDEMLSGMIAQRRFSMALIATFAAVVTLLATVTAVANWLPARRAARIDLSIALRGE